MRNRQILFRICGGALTLDPTPVGPIRHLLEQSLTIVEKKQLRGWEAKLARKDGKPLWYEEFSACYGYDEDGMLVTGTGFYRRLKQLLEDYRYQVRMVDQWQHPKPQVFEPFWDRLKQFNLRYRQDEFLEILLSRRMGRFSCPPGFGKSFMIGVLATVLPRARIHVITKRVAVLRERILPSLQQMLPDVVMIGGGQRHSMRHRVTCITADSLHRSDFNADIVIADEVHELAADKVSAQLPFYTGARMFGFSATHDMRLDQKDLRLEGLFGPIVFEMGYQEAVAHGLVSDLEVVWRTCSLGKSADGEELNPCQGLVDTAKRRRGIWRNAKRNSMIAEDARRYDQDTQVLITCETVEHALFLRRRLPEFTIVYSEQGMPPERYEEYLQMGLIKRSEPPMTTERRVKLTRAFEQGRLKKAICTSVWNVGVDFKPLAVLIRADAGGSPIQDTQIPGRASRINEGKSGGVIHDYNDVFDPGFRTKSAKRRKSYAGNGWRQRLLG
jgi:superfamily II DNA or RNA helicase